MEVIDPKQSNRAEAFALWISAPMPMVTLFKTLDVTRPVRLSRKRGLKLNMLLCWCIGRAASQIEEFLTLPVDGKLVRYDKLAVSTVVALPSGGVSTCDIPFSQDLETFQRDYLRLTAEVRDSGVPHDLEDHMVIGTSALPQMEIDGAVNIYAGIYNNPFVIWGKYRKRLFKASLPVSFQFHHTQMDGGHAAAFLEAFQTALRSFD